MRLRDGAEDVSTSSSFLFVASFSFLQMKRTRQERDARNVECDTDWASLPRDLVRALAFTEPSALPALYLVSKHYYTSLVVVHPNADMWKAYFQLKPGYSGHRPEPSFLPTWRHLVAHRARLCPFYSLVTRRARFESDRLAPSGVTADRGWKIPEYRERIVEWVDEKREICEIDEEEEIENQIFRCFTLVHEAVLNPSFKLTFSRPLVVDNLSANITFSHELVDEDLPRPKYSYRNLWCPATNMVFQERTDNSTQTIQMRPVAGPRDECLGDVDWRLERMIGII